MLERADRPIEDVIRLLAGLGVEAGYLVPTETGLDKSILDADSQLREYLKARSFHDFESQSQGPEARVLARAWIVGADTVTQTNASLYRPSSKKGDPRIWISKLPSHARAGNLLAVFVYDGELHVANTSDPGVLESIQDGESPLGRLVRSISGESEGPAMELLSKLRDISSLGFVPSLRKGATGVGMTLETMLGITANSSKVPDFKGIELKASRRGAGKAAGNRISLFSKVPDWKASKVGSATSLLEQHGYDRAGRRQLYCSMNHVPNTLGLFLAVFKEDLHAMHMRHTSATEVVQWDIDGLRQALLAKHQQTFWVKALVKRDSAGVESFHYTNVLRTRAPLASNLPSLLEIGKVEVDFTLSLKPRLAGQSPRVRDHGYLFKLDPRDMGLLFPPSVAYELS